MTGRRENITFPGSQGQSLAARLDLPPGKPIAYALFAHCFACTKDIFAAGRIAAGLVRHGIGVLRFDFTGLGASEGEFANTNFSSNIEDLVAAIDHMRGAIGAPAILIGHSLGGAAVLAAAHQAPEAKAVCTIGAPADPAHVVHNFKESLAEIEATGEAEVRLGGKPFRIKKRFLDDLKEQALETAVAGLHKALLIMHAPTDQTVGIENASRIFLAAKHPKSFVSLDNADHLLSRKADAAYVADVIAAWATRYVGGLAEPAAKGPTAAPGTVLVQGAGRGRLQQTISVGGRHALLADEPTSNGGDDTGPDPYEYLMAALGACTAMTVRLYAARKEIPLTDVSVEVDHKKVDAEDIPEGAGREGIVDLFTRTIDVKVEGDIDPTMRARLLEIANKCPVHRTLSASSVIASRLKE